MTIHLYVGDTTSGLMTAFCGWRVSGRHTSPDWRAVTCALCLGRRAGLTAQAVRDSRLTTQQPTTSSTSLKGSDMNISEAFPSLYLKAADLQGRDVVVTIVKVGFEAVGHTRSPTCTPRGERHRSRRPHSIGRSRIKPRA
jgi:hypothetical protein